MTSARRFEAVTSGAVDLECGSTTDNLERRKQVDFSPTHYVSAAKLLVRRDSPIRSYRDLRGKKVVVTAGTTNAEAIHGVFEQLKIAAEIVTGHDHAGSFGLVKEGKVDAFALDDVLLYASSLRKGRRAATTPCCRRTCPTSLRHHVPQERSGALGPGAEDVRPSSRSARAALAL